MLWILNNQIGSFPPHATSAAEVPNHFSLVGEDFQLATLCRSSEKPREVWQAASIARRRNADFCIHNLKIMEGGFKGQDLLIKLMQEELNKESTTYIPEVFFSHD